MTLRAGSVSYFAESMASAMEDAFAAELYEHKQALLPAAGTDDRHMLFAAIAQGVLSYLHDHLDELQIVIGPDHYDLQFDYAKDGS